MPSSLANVIVHIVFSTKMRHPFLRDRAHQVAVHRYLAEISQRLGCPTIAVNGGADHVHLLGRQARTLTVADWVKELKRASSLWAKTLHSELSNFQWQEGYGAFSVSQSLSHEVEVYIDRQEQHHQTFDFQRELRMLLASHEVPYDERYLWD